MTSLGHLVLYVRDLERSLDFYTAVVGLREVGRLFRGRGVMLTGGATHHELMLLAVGDAPGPLSGRRIGLYHSGWKVGDAPQALVAAKQRAEDAGCVIDGMADHTITLSLYLRDPDGNEVELYVDNPQVDWRGDDSWLDDPVKQLQL
jgi:catechol 2,3-dioxygenase